MNTDVRYHVPLGDPDDLRERRDELRLRLHLARTTKERAALRDALDQVHHELRLLEKRSPVTGG